METSSTSSPTVSPTKADSNSVDAINHLVQGKRHLLVRDYASAVSSLQEACKLLAERYGETANECGEAYFYYGKALLELSRMENGVLGNALQGVPDDDEDEDEEEDGEKDSDDSAVENPDTVTAEEREKVSRAVKAALEENYQMLAEMSAKLSLKRNADCSKNDTGGEEAKEKGENAPIKDSVVVLDEDSESKEESEDKEEDKSEDIEEDSEKEETAKATVASGDNAEPGPSTKSKKDEEKEEEDISNLELAWEILELAKLIFQRQSQGNRELQLKTSEVLMKLGEVSIESDNYAQAIDDLSECLNMRMELLAVDDRLIADVYYQLGLAYSLSNSFDNAIDNFNKAIDVIQLRIDNLKKLVEGKPKENGFLSDDPIDMAREEIDELEGIIPDIKSKIEDTQDLKRNQQLSLKEAALERLCGEGIVESSSSSVAVDSKSSPSKPASNITHLVKRKRKPDESGESTAVKKTKNSEAGDESCRPKLPLEEQVSSTVGDQEDSVKPSSTSEQSLT